jgi:Zn-dependent protease
MDQINFVEFGMRVGMIFVPLLFALCFHEFSHGLVAKWLGDRTAELQGRLSLNPAVHADLFGTWILPLTSILMGGGFLFAWAKPVPVNSRNLKHPRQDLFWIALAGPMSNVILALVSTLILGVLFGRNIAGFGGAFVELLKNFILVNVSLAFFNLIPVHPLDGGKVIAPFLSARTNIWLEQNQFQLSMGLLLLFILAGPILAFPMIWASQELFSLANTIAAAVG